MHQSKLHSFVTINLILNIILIIPITWSCALDRYNIFVEERVINLYLCQDTKNHIVNGQYNTYTYIHIFNKEQSWKQKSIVNRNKFIFLCRFPRERVFKGAPWNVSKISVFFFAHSPRIVDTNNRFRKYLHYKTRYTYSVGSFQYLTS